MLSARPWIPDALSSAVARCIVATLSGVTLYGGAPDSKVFLNSSKRFLRSDMVTALLLSRCDNDLILPLREKFPERPHILRLPKLPYSACDPGSRGSRWRSPKRGSQERNGRYHRNAPRQRDRRA